MKEITDAVKLRRRTQEVFELAALPGEGSYLVGKLSIVI